MTLNLCVLTPTRILWDSKVKVKEIILSIIDDRKIGVLPNHVPLVTELDIGILKIRLNDQWVTIALMGGFAIIRNNEIQIFAHDGEKVSDIDLQEAQQALQIAKDNLREAEGKVEKTIEADLVQAVKRAELLVKAVNTIS